MEKLKRLTSAFLCLVMLLSLFPAITPEAEAAGLTAAQLEVDSDYTAKVYPGMLGDDNVGACFLNYAWYNSDNIDTLLSSYIGPMKTKKKNKKWEREKTIYRVADTKDEKNTMTSTAQDGTPIEADPSLYNMLNCFGISDSSSVTKAPLPGFSIPKQDNFSVNKLSSTDDSRAWEASLFIGGQDSTGGYVTINIAQNPTLKAMAKTGQLEMYFYGLVLSCQESVSGKKDDKTFTAGKIEVVDANGKTHTYQANAGVKKKNYDVNGNYHKKEEENYYEPLTTGGWITLGENSTITISYTAVYRRKVKGKKGRGKTGYNNGIGDAILLLRDRTCPTLDGYDLTSNAVASGSEALLGMDGYIDMSLSFSEPVATTLQHNNMPATAEYQLLEALGSHTLFKNSTSSVYGDRGKSVNLNLVSYTDPLGNQEVQISSSKKRVEVFTNGFKQLNYQWKAGEWDYYGNAAVPNAGDWAGSVHQNNILNFMDKLVLASFHDYAGNPLSIKDTSGTYKKIAYEKRTAAERQAALKKDPNDTNPYKTELSNDILIGNVTLKNQVRKNIGNPFYGADTSSTAGYNFVIDAVPPHYERRSNPVQPDILTGLTLNSKSESFTVKLNFDEIVQLKRFKADGTETYYNTSDLMLVLYDGTTYIYAPYESGNFSKTLRFNVKIPSDAGSGVYFKQINAPEINAALTAGKTLYKLNSDGSYEKTELSNKNSSYYVIDIPALEVKGFCLADTDGQGNVTKVKVVNLNEKSVWYKAGVPAYNASAAGDYLFTDKVGNELAWSKNSRGQYTKNGQLIGQSYVSNDGAARERVGYDTTMSWAQVTVDNVAPTITIKKNPAASYSFIISANDGSGSGIYYVKNYSDTSDNRQKGLIYYIWVREDELNDTLNALTKNDYALVKQYTQTARCEEGNKSYPLQISQNGEPVTAPEDMREGSVYLIAFTSDMTWDSSRQRIQYSMATYKQNPSAYFDILVKRMKEVGIDFDPSKGLVDPLTEQPKDWYVTDFYDQDGKIINNYSQYFYAYETQNGTLYKKLPIASTYPAFTGEVLASGTDLETTAYYNMDYKYTVVENTTNYEQVPADWEEEHSRYFVADTYEAVVNKQAPEFELNKFYSKEGDTYTLLEARPKNWGTDFQSYYERHGGSYETAVNHQAPVFRSGKYYQLVGEDYVLLTSEPDDWASSYGSYYTPATYKNTNVMTGIPAYVSGKRYTEYKLVDEIQNAKTNPADYYVLTDKGYEKALEVYAPEYDEYACVYTGATENTQLKDEPENWYTNYVDYYYSDAPVYYAAEKPVYDQKDADKTKTYEWFTKEAVALTQEPADWEDNYTSYFELDQVADAPFAADTFYQFDENGLIGESKFGMGKPGSYYMLASAPLVSFNSALYYILKPIEEVTNIPDFGALPVYRSAPCSSQTNLTATPTDWISTCKEYTHFEKATETDVFAAESYAVYEQNVYVILRADEETRWEEALAAGNCYKLASVTSPNFPVEECCKLKYEYVRVTATPTDWEETYDNYSYEYNFVSPELPESDDENVVVDDSVVCSPAFELETYYSYDPETEQFALLTEKPADWDTNCRAYFTKEWNDVHNAYEGPKFVAGTYFKKETVRHATKVENELTKTVSWNKYSPTNKEIYDIYLYAFLRNDLVFHKIVANIEEGTAIYKKLAKPVLMTEEPSEAHWNQYYGEYYYKTVDKDKGEVLKKLEAITYPNFEYGKIYYHYTYCELTFRPEDWETDYENYYYEVEGGFARAVVTERNKKCSIPSFDPTGKNYCGPYYTTSRGINDLADAMGLVGEEKSERRETFMTDMVNADSTQKWIEVIRAYNEFSRLIELADKEMLTIGSDPDTWDTSKFRTPDSNWAYLQVNTSGPALTQVGGIEGNESKNVSVTVNIEDPGNELTYVGYIFAKPEEKVTAESQNWTKFYGTGDQLPTGNNFVFTKNALTADYDGDYNLYLKVIDNAGITVMKKVTTVTLKSTAGLYFFISNPSGFSPYQSIANITVAASGDKLNADSQLHVYYEVSKNSQASGNWTELQPNKGTYQYAIPAFQADSTQAEDYYLHLKYEYMFSGGKVTETDSRTYRMQKPDDKLKVNITAMGEDYITLMPTLSNADAKIEYALTATENEPITAFTEIELLDTLTVRNKDFPETVWFRAKVNGGAEQKFKFDMPKAAAVPDVTASLKRVYLENEVYYAIVALDLDEAAMVSGAEYSYTTDGANWKQWTPFDSVVKVKLGSSLAELKLMFKFRNGSSVTEAKDYQKVKITQTMDDGTQWAYVTRSTLKSIGTDKTLTLTFIDHTGAEEQKVIAYNDVKNTDGRYDYKRNNVTLTQAVVSNFDDTPPLYVLAYNHMTSSYSISSPETIRILAVTFTPADISKAAENCGRVNTYKITDNGILRFFIADEAGNKATAEAVISWIDNVAPEFDVVFKDKNGIEISADKKTTGKFMTIQLKQQEAVDVVIIDKDGEEEGLSTETNLYEITENGKYQILVTDKAGNMVKKDIVIDNIFDGENDPIVVVKRIDASHAQAIISGTALESEGIEIYDGGGKIVTEDYSNVAQMDGYNYSFTKDFYVNGTFNYMLTDSLGFGATYTVTVDCLDDQGPAFVIPEDLVLLTTGTSKTEQQWNQWLIDTYQISDESGFTVECDTLMSIVVKQPGAYTLTLTATDSVGNVSYAVVTVYVMPSTGLLITDKDRGVLFCSTSSSASLVDGNRIVLKINRFDRMIFGANRAVGDYAVNRRATVEGIVQKGAFREGQLKFFTVMTRPVVYDRSDPNNAVAYLTMTPDELPGTGWYTVLIRTADREREFTTFFVSKLSE